MPHAHVHPPGECQLVLQGNWGLNGTDLLFALSFSLSRTMLRSRLAINGWVSLNHLGPPLLSYPPALRTILSPSLPLSSRRPHRHPSAGSLPLLALFEHPLPSTHPDLAFFG